MEGFVKFCNRTISLSFYTLFILVPLFFTNSTSELFELNKMWITWGLTLVIGAAWFSKMIASRSYKIQRTPLDIPLGLFLISQFLSTIFSLDPRTSLWGYYSRFNGGLLSLLAYGFLYYAFVANMNKKQTIRVLQVSLVTGLLVALWGIPSHFGKDPTCLVFRGTFDTSCWTDAFQPTVRAFSTLGQPAWLAAYVSILLPLSIVFFINILPQLYTPATKHKARSLSTKSFSAALYYLLLTILLYMSLIFANTRGGFFGFVGGFLVFVGLLIAGVLGQSLGLIKGAKQAIKPLLYSGGVIGITLLVLTILYGSSLGLFTSFSAIFSGFAPPKVDQSKEAAAAASGGASVLETGITDSGVIRSYVWKGAVDAWLSSPLFGTGVETFAFAYYRYKPAGHNTTSEWDYLYNKAHNEYLNYLATTGLLGLGTHLVFLAFFFWISIKWFFLHEDTEENQRAARIIAALVGSVVSIIISNFFGFSVVIVNLYLFLIPAFVLLLSGIIPEPVLVVSQSKASSSLTGGQWTGVVVITFIAGFSIIQLMRFWYADTEYALGHNLDSVGEYGQAYPHLLNAYQTRPAEPVIADEFALDNASLAAASLLQKDTKTAQQFLQQGVSLSDQIILDHPNNIVFWKDRVRLFYTLSQADKQYLVQALQAMQQAEQLAPNDAKIVYNVGVLYGQTGNSKKGAEELEKAIKLKPGYRDAYFALGLFYHDLATENEKVKDPALEQKAKDALEYVLRNIDPKDKQVNETLKSWGYR